MVKRSHLRAETGEEVVRIPHYPGPVLRRIGPHAPARPRHDISAQVSDRGQACAARKQGKGWRGER